MRDITGALGSFWAELKKPATIVARVFTITPVAGAVLRFTDYSEALTVGGDTYLPASAFTVTALRKRADASVDTQSADLLTGDDLTENRLLAGVYDHAEVTMSLALPGNEGLGLWPMARRYFGEIGSAEIAATVELRSLTEMMQRPVGRIYLKTCDARFGDARCGLDLDALGFVHAATIADSGPSISPIDRAFDVSSVQADGYFQYGVCRFTDGLNLGVERPIVHHADDRVTLLLPPPFPIANGDGLALTRGCDKTFPTCRDVYANYLNFRGFPDMPTDEELSEVGGDA